MVELELLIAVLILLAKVVVPLLTALIVLLLILLVAAVSWVPMVELELLILSRVAREPLERVASVIFLVGA
jgi:hypothetical protein